MSMRNIILSSAALALIVGPAPAPVTGSAEARSIARPAPDDGLCKVHEVFNNRPYPGRPRPMGRAGVQGGPQPAVLPPSPPPPPPAAVAPPPPSQNTPVTVTGARVDKEAAADAAKPSGGVVVPRPPRGRYFPYPIPPQDREQYEGEDVAGIKAVVNEPVSTFAVDVDTGAYANMRRFLKEGRTPPKAAIRTEELINYFRYDYPLPGDSEQPFSITTDMAVSPWNSETRLLRVGLRGYDLDYRERPAANLVFLIDVSGSMRSPNKLPLVKSGLSLLADQIRLQDRVSIVVYSGSVGKLLSPCNKPEIIKSAIRQLRAGGSTAGGEGMKLAYETARANYDARAVNRIVMATDGDFNVGITNRDTLKDYVAKQREKGVTLTTLGFGTGNYNEALMEQIANVGNGNYAYIDSAMEAQKVLEEEMSSTLFTIAKDVKIQIEFNPAHVSEYRLIGYENRLLAEEDFDNDAVDAGDIGASHQVTALYEIVPAGSKGWLPGRRYEANRKAGDRAITAAGKSDELGYIKLRYKLPKGSKSRLIERPLAASMLTVRRAPSGDMAFATAVAAFGQKLRGDKHLGQFSYGDIRALAAQRSNSFWRQEFVKLTELAGGGN